MFLKFYKFYFYFEENEMQALTLLLYKTIRMLLKSFSHVGDVLPSLASSMTSFYCHFSVFTTQGVTVTQLAEISVRCKPKLHLKILPILSQIGRILPT